MNLRKIGTYAVGGILWLSTSAICDHYVGTNSAPLILLGIFAIGAVVQISRKWLRERAINIIDPNDDRPVRFEGTAEQAEIASAVATARGWIVEDLPSEKSGEVSIRFMRGEQATAARDLVQALFDADIARKVRP